MQLPLVAQAVAPATVRSLDIALEEKAKTELGFTKKQVEKLTELRNTYPRGEELINTISPEKKVGFLSDDEMKELLGSIPAKIAPIRDAVQKEMYDILNDRQLKRLRQLYLQDLVMNRPRALRASSLELDIELSRDERTKLLEQFGIAESEVRAELALIRYLRYREGWIDVLGKKKANTLFGMPYGVDLKEPFVAREETTNPRRFDGCTPVEP